MTKLVILNLGKGDFRQGFSTVTVQLWEDTIPIQMVGSLPAAPEISELYRRWQLLYCLLHEALYQDRSWRKLRSDFINDNDVEVEEEDITNVSLIEFSSLCQDLQHHINIWLKSLSFIHVTQKLRTKLAPLDEIKFIFETEDEEVRKIPWHLWDFFEDYVNAVVCLSSPEFEYLKPIATLTRPMRILAILGNSEGIDIQKDRAILELTNAQTIFLVEPQRKELDYWLWDKQGWDIIFFAGHSQSNGEGTIQINKKDSLTISQLKNGLRAALSNGLSLAIFNSCDGLGLARDLASLHIPQIIVMREPVPDVIAQTFLTHFIEAFATGKSLYLSVREAQAKLQGLEDEYPCASWLPVICQNPAAAPLIWRTNKIAHKTNLPKKVLFGATLQVSLLVTAFIIGARGTGILQSWELSAFDQIMRIRPAEQPDNRILVITVTAADVQAQSPLSRGGASLSDQTLASVMEKIQQFNPRVIGLDIYRENPVQDNFKNLAAAMQSNNFIAVCQGGEDSADPADPGVPPPPEVSLPSIGFSDVVPDPDTILRRQLLAMAPPTAPSSKCKTDKSFNYRVATRYLADQNIYPRLTSDKNLAIGDKVFNNLQPDSGGYHNINSQGHQVLLNWRAANPYIKQVTVQDVLDNKLTADLVKDKIVLIGTIANSFNDLRWSTPYTTGKWPYTQIAGVVVQAHMVSQILSAVLNNRPLLNVLPKWSEYLWIWSWSFVGAMIAFNIQSMRRLILGIIISCGVMVGICFYIFILGIWAPIVPSMLVLLGSTTGLRLYIQSKRYIK